MFLQIAAKPCWCCSQEKFSKLQIRKRNSLDFAKIKKQDLARFAEVFYFF